MEFKVLPMIGPELDHEMGIGPEYSALVHRYWEENEWEIRRGVAERINHAFSKSDLSPKEQLKFYPYKAGHHAPGVIVFDEIVRATEFNPDWIAFGVGDPEQDFYPEPLTWPHYINDLMETQGLRQTTLASLTALNPSTFSTIRASDGSSRRGTFRTVWLLSVTLQVPIWKLFYHEIKTEI